MLVNIDMDFAIRMYTETDLRIKTNFDDEGNMTLEFRHKSSNKTYKYTLTPDDVETLVHVLDQTFSGKILRGL